MATNMASVTTDTTNYTRIHLILMKGGTLLTKTLFLKRVKDLSPAGHELTVDEFLGKHRVQILSTSTGRNNEEKLYPPAGSSTNLDEWDLPLYCFILKTVCGLPNINKLDMEFLKTMRNELAHLHDPSLTDADFKSHLITIEPIFTRSFQMINDPLFEKEMKVLLQKCETGALAVDEVVKVHHDSNRKHIELLINQVKMMKNQVDMIKNQSVMLQNQTTHEAKIDSALSMLTEIKDRLPPNPDVDIPDVHVIIEVKNCTKEKEKELLDFLVKQFNETISDPECTLNKDFPNLAMYTISEAVCKTFKSFLEKGRHLLKVENGSISLTVKCNNISSFVDLIRDYIDGKLLDHLTDLKDAIQKWDGCSYIDFDLIVSPDEITEAILKLAKNLDDIVPKGIQVHDLSTSKEDTSTSCSTSSIFRLAIKPETGDQRTEIEKCFSSGSISERFEQCKRQLRKDPHFTNVEIEAKLLAVDSPRTGLMKNQQSEASLVSESGKESPDLQDTQDTLEQESKTNRLPQHVIDWIMPLPKAQTQYEVNDLVRTSSLYFTEESDTGMAAKGPGIRNIDDILNLELRSAAPLAKIWEIDIKGVSGLDGIKNLLLEHWLHNRPPGDTEGRYNLANASKDHQKIRTNLYEKYKKGEQLYSALTAKIKANLEQTHPDIPKTFQDRKESLKSGECTIVVAGEVGSGKSSLLNLILETQLFPTDSLKCTNTLCEIRSHDRKEAIFYYKRMFLSNSGERERKISPRIVKLSCLSGIQEFKDCVAEMNQSDDNPYERCEVFYPFPTLGKGIVLLDTPGIEGGDNVDQRLQTYLSKAFGFIYVFNTNTAGGVQQTRLGHLLKTVVNACDDFSPEASLFIGNKWEHVPEKDRNDVKQDTFQKISQIYPGLRSHQVHYMSVKKSTEIMMKFKQYNARIDEHNILLEKVSQLVPKSLRQGMVLHYWWLSSFLSRASYLLRVTSTQHAMSKEDMEKEFKDLQKHVEDLKKNANESVKRLRDKVEFEIYRISNAVKELLQAREFVNKVCNWEDVHDCPSTEKKWKNIVDNATMKISDRVARTLDGWVRANGVLRNIDKEIIEVFSRELGLMDHQIQELEACLTGSKTSHMMKTIRVVPVKALFAKKKKKIEKTYSTLGGAVSCIGMLDTNKKDVRRIFKDDYNNNTKTKKMAEATTLYLGTIIGNKDFLAMLRKFFDRFFKDIDEAAKRLPGFLEADQQLIETLQKSIDDGKKNSQRFPELVNGCSELLSKLDIFYINEIMHFDFELSELEWEKKKELGRGSFSIVYASKLKRKDRPVALKVSLESVTESNVTDVLTEDRTMRDLRHINVVRYYGSTYEKRERGIRWIMVMEMCQTTLKHIYTGPEKKERNIPGCLDKDHHRHNEAAKTMLDHALQISRGLEYIHDKGYTHRDMKLENVLLTDDNVIKITDVGVTKKTDRIRDTTNGSPAYMAPEVLQSGKNQTNKIDIYSMTIMFWEMWFGQDVAALMNKEILGYGFHGDAISALRDKLSRPDGWRPPLNSPRRPPDVVCDMLKKGWSLDPECRPTAKQIAQFLQEYIRNNL